MIAKKRFFERVSSAYGPTIFRNTVEAAYMGRLGTRYSCLLYPMSFKSIVQLSGPGDRNMHAN